MLPVIAQRRQQTIQDFVKFISPSEMVKQEPSCNNEQNLFAFPAQCNMTGDRFPLDWIAEMQNKDYLVLLDASSYCSSTRVNLSLYPADFVVLSFYKLFGYPTGLGALIVKSRAVNKMKKTYMGGGTVSAIGISPFFSHAKSDFASAFEDGTIPFQQIISLRHGFDFIQKYYSGWDAYSQFWYNDFLKLVTRCVKALWICLKV